MADKVRIKDIAEKSGVSVGTVDRVLHNRPNVSKTAREKVEKSSKKSTTSQTCMQVRLHITSHILFTA